MSNNELYNLLRQIGELDDITSKRQKALQSNFIVPFQLSREEIFEKMRNRFNNKSVENRLSKVEEKIDNIKTHITIKDIPNIDNIVRQTAEKAIKNNREQIEIDILLSLR